MRRNGRLAYDLEATMRVYHSATAVEPADDRIGIIVLDCLQCDGTGAIRLDANAAIVRRDPASNSAWAWFGKTIPQRNE